jgi:diaminopimelate decarboxylase
MTRSINHSLSLREGHLFIEDCDTHALAQQFGTPLFVLSESHIRHNLQRFQQAFESQWSQGIVEILPSFKACPLLAVRQMLSSLEIGCDVFGAGELEGALRGAVAPEKISVNGSVKDITLIERAVGLGAHIVLDSPRELQLCIDAARSLNKQANILLRMKPFMQDLQEQSDFLPDMQIREMTQMIKYGIPSSELLGMLPILAESEEINLLGVHVHMGRHSKKANVWQAWVRHCVLLLQEICRQLPHWQPQIINIGGGYASGCDRDTDVLVQGYDAPSLETLAASICTALKETLLEAGIEQQGLRLQLEPGRAMFTDAGIHLTRIRNIKTEQLHRPRRWCELDTSEVFLGIPGLNFEPPFDYAYANRAELPTTHTVDLVGQTCNAELLFQQVPAPMLEVGDTVALLNTGSYIESMAANFNSLPRPGTVLVNGAEAHLIKQHETIDQVFERDQIPAHLQASDNGKLYA